MDKKINVALNGAGGRMGRAIAEVLDADSAMNITHAYERAGSPHIAKRLSDIADTRSAIAIAASDTMYEGSFDVLIDFSTPDSVMAAAQHCRVSRCPMVIGVTGFSDTQQETLAACAKEIPLLLSPNMSLGVNICFLLLEQIMRTEWGVNAEVDIIETHHKHKKDKPSGTALRMGEIVADEKGHNLKDCAIYDEAARQSAADIRFVSHREGERTGEHRVIFNAGKELIELRHEAHDRTPFASGAVYAAQWIVFSRPQPGRIYTMDDAIGRPTY